MKLASLPLVSIVTPVYNGEEYLAECIESIIEQTYQNWEYIILNNRSADGTLEIAQEYASRDDRIKVITNEEFLKQIPNWNESLRKISPESKYCKVVHADDWLYSECIEKMVARAQEYPTAGIISAYRLMGSKVRGVRGRGLPYETKFLTGKEAGRKVLLTSLFLFGSPTSVLYRSDLIREKESFYDTSVVHADTDICFDILRKHDFAFVHQILSFTRLHEQATSTFTNYYETNSLFEIYTVKKYGEYYLTSEEYKKLLSQKIANHHRWLAKLMLDGRGKKVWEYHKEELARMNMDIHTLEISKAFLLELAKIKPAIRWFYKTFKKLFAQKDRKNIVDEKKDNIVFANTE